LGSLGASLSLFSAIRMQNARDFLFVLKPQTREKKTELFHLTKKADVYSEGMKHWWNDADREKSKVPGEKPVHEPLFPPYIPRGRA